MKDGRQRKTEEHIFIRPLSGPGPQAPRGGAPKESRQKNIFRIAAFASLPLILIITFYLAFRPSGPGIEINRSEVPPENPILTAPAPNPTIVEAIILPGETLSDILEGQGLSPAEIDALVKQVKPVFDLAKIISGRTMKMTFAPDGRLQLIDYPIDENQYLLVTRTETGDRAEKKSYAFEIRTAYVSGTIDEHLYGAILAQGEEPGLVFALEQIFGWDIDFYAGIQTGDAFRLLIEKKYLDGRFQRYGNILAAEFWNDGRRTEAFRYEYEDSGKKKSGYFHSDGRSLRKEFFKSPLLSYKRISSRFTARRLHPIRKVYRAHYGVDYAAPVGTPVFATADGKVEEAGWNGGAGRMIRLSHKKGYETIYMHLSTILVRAGQKVEGGQMIGKVGTSGESTGPHLDYRIKLYGKYLNPLSAKFEAVDPLDKKWLPDFNKRAAVLRVLLEMPLHLYYSRVEMAAAAKRGG